MPRALCLPLHCCPRWASTTHPGGPSVMCHQPTRLGVQSPRRPGRVGSGPSQWSHCWSHCYPAQHPLLTLQGPEVSPIPGSLCTSQCFHDASVMGGGCHGFQQMPYRGGLSPRRISRGALLDLVLTQAICSQKEFLAINNSTRNSRKTRAFVDSSLPCC